MNNIEPCNNENKSFQICDSLLELSNKFMLMKVLHKINTLVDFRDMIKDDNYCENQEDLLNFRVFKKVLIDSVNKVKEIPGIYDCYREFVLILDIINEKKIYKIEDNEIEEMSEICEKVMSQIDYTFKKKTNKLRNLKNKIRKLKKALNS